MFNLIKNKFQSEKGLTAGKLFDLLADFALAAGQGEGYLNSGFNWGVIEGEPHIHHCTLNVLYMKRDGYYVDGKMTIHDVHVNFFPHIFKKGYYFCDIFYKNHLINSTLVKRNTVIPWKTDYLKEAGHIDNPIPEEFKEIGKEVELVLMSYIKEEHQVNVDKFKQQYEKKQRQHA